ncbi:hypothetical protein [Citrifermentans bremense]|uniref:hypothetical protein n=1 Tax=Citrifermentans bremense TaxID=60035 RepID=UPI0004112FD3|nr:hypothetical protein [Citrifermentans bremense]
MRLMLTVILFASLSLRLACASPAPELPKKPSMNPHGGAMGGGSISPHGAPSGSIATAGPVGMTAAIKGVTLSGYPKMKVGEAFDNYRHFKQKSWRETTSVGGTVYVDFTGSAPARWLDFKAKREGISASGIEVKFAIYPNGEYGVVMASRTVVKTDGKTNRYPLPDVKSVLDAIYSNRKIDL